MSRRSSLKLVTGPTSEPVTLNELKLAARIDSADEDPLLQTYLVAARQAVEEFTRRVFLTQTLRLTIDLERSQFANVADEGFYDLPVTVLHADLPRVINLPKPPIIAITSVTTYGLDNTGTVFASSNYTLDADGGRLALNYSASWPSSLRAVASVAILYTAGYGSSPNDVPQAIRTGIIMHAQRMYDSRIICELPEDCKRLLMPYRIMDALSA